MSDVDSITSFNLEIGEVDAVTRRLHNVGLDPEIDSVMDASLSDQVGPGRTIGNWISKSGRKVEQFVGKVSERLGRGPSAVMERIVSRVNELCSWEVQPRIIRLRSLLRPPRTFGQILESAMNDIIIRADVFIADPEITQNCGKLVKFLNDGHSTTRALAVYYITTIICVLPESQLLFLRLGALEIVRKSYSFLTMLPRQHRDRDLLLAPSRRALVFLSDTEVLSAIREYDALSMEEFSLDPSKRTPIPRKWDILASLIRYSAKSECRLPAARQLTHIPELMLGFCHPAMELVVGPDLIQCWAELSLSSDQLVASTYFKLLLSFQRVCENMPKNNSWVWRCYFLPMFRVYLRGLDKHSGIELSQGLNNNFFPRGKDYLAATLTGDMREQLGQMLVHTTPTPGPTGVASLVAEFLHPFIPLWRRFVHEWTFSPRAIGSPLPIIRALSSKKRRSLCQKLVDLAMRSECSLNDVMKVVEQDYDCLWGVLDALAHFCHARTHNGQLARTLAKGLLSWASSRAKSPIAFRPTEIHQGVCSTFSSHAGHRIMVFYVDPNQGDIFAEREHEYTEVSELYAEHSHLRWVSMDDPGEVKSRYNPVYVGPGTEKNWYWIGRRRDKLNSSATHVFSVEVSQSSREKGGELMFSLLNSPTNPDPVDSITQGSLYILSARQVVGDRPTWAWLRSMWDVTRKLVLKDVHSTSR
ncbi:hypothetical protein JAAARDRAFT_78145 [Jaapia argillacea MUCL 33604]|uniref:Uncharacterized protein n=1 Tax=Jaapia argillacea MUCL 33604 TaxID=933084 RepID=A0A067Q4F9_9AGAM|nr:hypothetical protein JAAARDRAFT_78145 [Jaapia argillacea MUCL 33604]